MTKLTIAEKERRKAAKRLFKENPKIKLSTLSSKSRKVATGKVLRLQKYSVKNKQREEKERASSSDRNKLLRSLESRTESVPKKNVITGFKVKRQEKEWEKQGRQVAKYQSKEEALANRNKALRAKEKVEREKKYRRSHTVLGKLSKKSEKLHGKGIRLSQFWK